MILVDGTLLLCITFIMPLMAGEVIVSKKDGLTGVLMPVEVMVIGNLSLALSV